MNVFSAPELVKQRPELEMLLDVADSVGHQQHAAPIDERHDGCRLHHSLVGLSP